METDETLKRPGRGGLVSVALGFLAAALVVVGVYFSWKAPGVLGGLLWPIVGVAILLLNLAGLFLAASALARRNGVVWAIGGLAIHTTSVLCVIGVLYLIFVPRAPPGQPYTLPSGKQIRITAVGPMYFSKDQPALMMQCDTETSIGNMPELRKEVDEIWEIFRHDVEAAHMKSAVIRMNHNVGTGLITRGEGYGFVYKQADDGRWHALEDEKKK
jgi:hypothetical protein